jgi:hypothetical protein
MPRKTGTSKKQKLVIKQSRSPKELEDFIREADEVRLITTQAGWHIIERDITEYRNSLINKLAYTDPTKPEFREAVILFVASDKLLALINDYQENRDKAIELMNKLENPNLAVAMDIDGE